ncbi:MAG: 3-isopropylmalate dehydrogenase, partial [Candidatus Margulisbacteria bacterium]|nr:3-isopropylmalate dehydrogenase [Candidatus Margulisiibacteriota bacterium]
MTYKIALIGGDGTGPEVVAEGLKVLKAVSKKHKFDYKLEEFDFSGKRYLKSGELVSDKDIEKLKTFDTIYLGAVGDPEVKPGILEHGVLLRIRFALDQYINLRPVILYPNVDTPIKDKGPKEIDFVVVRENTEGLYAGTGGYLRKGTPDEIATQVSVNTRKGVERCLRYAFEYTKKRNKRKQLTLVGKTNVLTYAFDLWERAFHEIGQKDYPEIKREYAHVDATCMWFVKNPEWFDCIVTDNMFGDIITDLGAMVQGGMEIG